MSAADAKPDLEQLIGLFYESEAALGSFREVAPESLPRQYHSLLCHEEHMTVAMEAFHESLVGVEVLDTQTTATHYSRKILLRRQIDNRVVQFGIPRIDLRCLTDEIRAEVEAQRRPLGRILVRNNILRTIHLDALWRVTPGEELCRLLEIDHPIETYGRTAVIDLDGEPAIELLEIVAPLETFE